MDNVKTYTFGNKTWEQRPMTYGQVRQLLDLLRAVEMPERLDYQSILSALGDRVPLALAIVLTEQSKSPAGKDLTALASEIEFSIPAETVGEVIADFFALTPVAKLIDMATGALQGVLAFQGGWMRSTAPSSDSSSPSVGEMSPEETPSSGSSDQEAPAPG